MVPAAPGVAKAVPATPLVAMEFAQMAVSLVDNYRGEVAWGKWRAPIQAGRRSTAALLAEPSGGA